MSNNRFAALALTLGTCAGFATMALHPTGRDVMQHASASESNALASTVHILALLGQGLLLTGALALPRLLRARPGFASGGYVFYALAAVAVILAAVASGRIAP